MDPVSLFLLAVAAIFLIGIVGEIVFEKTGVPDVVWLIVVGIVLGPIAGFVKPEALSKIAPYFGALTLVVVLFDGGSKLNLGELRHAAGRSTLLALASFVLSVAAVAVLSMLGSMIDILPREDWTWLHAITLGTIVGGSSSVVIMPALRKAGLAPKLSNLVNLESALTDVLCVVSTIACIAIAKSGEADIGNAGITLGKSFGLGLGVGIVAGLMFLLALRKVRKSAYGYPVTLGTLLIVYVIIEELGGSAALGILTVAVIVGNARDLSKVVGLEKTARLGSGVTNTHDQITFIIKSFFFVFIGAMLSGSFSLIAFGVFLGLALLVARVPAVMVGTAGTKWSLPAKGLVGVSMPRGMAAGVLAMLPWQNQMAGTQELPVVVFACVFTTIMVFAVGFPLLRARLAKVDPDMLVAVVPLAPNLQNSSSTVIDYGPDTESLPPGASSLPPPPQVVPQIPPTSAVPNIAPRVAPIIQPGPADATRIDPNPPDENH